MQLTRHTDYGLRTLIYLGLHPDGQVTATQIADAFQVSRNHLLKVIQRLAALGLVRTRRGKGGGLALARPPEEINVAEVIRGMEGNMELVHCDSPLCPILPSCRLRPVLDEAREAFLQSLERYSIENLLLDRESSLRELLVTPGG